MLRPVVGMSTSSSISVVEFVVQPDLFSNSSLTLVERHLRRMMTEEVTVSRCTQYHYTTTIATTASTIMVVLLLLRFILFFYIALNTIWCAKTIVLIICCTHISYFVVVHGGVLDYKSMSSTLNG